uniref:THAP domain-containing protein 4 n=1 Tax=Cacopsylla melanoneura TaxID=428564 RepID=A0A8D8PSC8_9HEMI
MDKLHWLKGIWKSTSAQGVLPNRTPFTYIDTLSITQTKNKPYLNFSSNTINNEEDRKAMHCEVGFLRMVNNGICLQLAHNFGVNSVEKGAYDEANGTEFHLESTSLVRVLDESALVSPSKAKVVKLRRHFKLIEGGRLEQCVDKLSARGIILGRLTKAKASTKCVDKLSSHSTSF